jgi:hypothetical protein
MLTVGGIDGFLESSSTGETFGVSGSATWGTNEANSATLPGNYPSSYGFGTDQIMVMYAYNTEVDLTSCDNKILVVIFLSPDFVMPDSDFNISIDFGGTAELCGIPEPDPPPADPPTAAANEIIDISYQLYITNTSINLSNDTVQFTNGESAGNATIFPACNLFVAQYYDNEISARSKFNYYNLRTYSAFGADVIYNNNDGFFVDGEAFNWANTPPVWDFSGASGSESAEYIPMGVYEWVQTYIGPSPSEALQFLSDYNYNSYMTSYQPTIYTPYNSPLIIGVSSWMSQGTTDMNSNTGDAPISTECGMLQLPGGDFADLYWNTQGLPNSMDGYYWMTAVSASNPNQVLNNDEHRRSLHRFRVSSEPSNYNTTEAWEPYSDYLNLINYPTITPSTPGMSAELYEQIGLFEVIPQNINYYISVGDNEEYNLDPEGVAIGFISSQATNVDLSIPGVSTTSEGGSCTIDSEVTDENGEVIASEWGISSYANWDNTTIDTNNSDIDLSQVEITSVDSKTVKLKLPHKSGFEIDRLTHPKYRMTKIFIFVSPTLIE